MLTDANNEWTLAVYSLLAVLAFLAVTQEQAVLDNDMLFDVKLKYF